nr:putative 8-amino-7-oxononanoate synthase [Quercus suber]
MKHSNAQPTSTQSSLEQSIAQSVAARKGNSTLRRLTTNPPNSADFSSNDFLSLATSSELRRDFLQELQNDPSLQNLGSGGSRLLDGNSIYAEQLERDIATFHVAESGLLCNSGFDANVGLFSCLPQPGDVIVYDEFIHASVHDGMKLSRAGRCIAFTHNDVCALKQILHEIWDGDRHVRDGRRNVFVAVEAVYSMDGDVAPLREVSRAVQIALPLGNGHLIVDEAHSTGVFGPQGKGLVCELGMEEEVTVRLHTFGKALAANGAILLCSATIRQYLINYARPMIYTTFMSYPALAAIRASYRYLMAGRTEPLAQKLQMLIRSLHVRLLALQTSLQLSLEHSALLSVSSACPQSSIFAVLSSEPKALAAHCQRNGFVVRGIVPPTVPVGTERVRVCLHAGNTLKEIEGLVATLRVWVLQRIKEQTSADLNRARL